MATSTDNDMLGSKWTTDEKGRSSYRIANVLAAKRLATEIIVKTRVKRTRKPKKQNAELQKVGKMGLLRLLIDKKIIEVRKIDNLPRLPNYNYTRGSRWAADNQGRIVRSSHRIAQVLDAKKLAIIVESDICNLGIRVR